MRSGPHQIDGGGATDGQALVWNAAADKWEPADVSAANGLPVGGTTGQVLTKVSGTDYDANWQTPSGGGGGGTGYDRRWNVGSAETSIDEFNDSSLAAAWTRVDGTGAASGNLTWSEDADVLSAGNVGGDSTATLHGLVQPLSGAGGSMANGDGFITCCTVQGAIANYSFGGLVLADGTTLGSGKQVAMASIGTGSITYRTLNGEAYSNWNSRTTDLTIGAAGLAAPVYLRLSLISANTWRGDTSPDGITWNPGTTFTQSFTPTYVGFLSSSWGTSTKHVASYEFLRRVSGVT